MLAYLPVGWPVLVKGWKSILKGDVFTEFFLVGIATLGAFAIGEYPEGVAVMLFYAIGELFQDAAVNRAKRNIKALLDIRPDSVSVQRNGQMVIVHPEEVQTGETIQVKPGEKVPLDGEMLREKSSFNTSALTGESKPATYNKGENVLAGMVNLDRLIELKVTRRFNESSLARILELVQNATARKSKTEQFIRKFARVYTPIVTFLAVGLTFLPYFFIENYVFEDWLYRVLIFLVISCPCALVISIPLGYFGGIGAASRKGILFKGSNFLDLMTRVNTVVMDKTGTLTRGVFEVQKAVTMDGITTDWLSLAAAMESKSTHPIAKAVTEYTKKQGGKISEPEQQEEIAGHGLKGKVNSKHLLIGNQKLMDKEGIVTCADAAREVNTVIHVAVDQKYAGYLVIADELKADAAQAINALHKSGVRELIMLSGDKDAVTQQVAKSLGIDKAFGDLLPEQKVEKVEELKKDTSRVIAFVGDGINDAPVLALADVGMAMGGLGSDAAIETADVVIQTDQPSKIATAIQIGKQTKRIVWQNISLAFGVKVIVLALGAGGLATMWEAVFADVGVAFLAILNAIRIQKMKF
ncbi:heavy metal translocating P-type ATPase [Echinicola vietnamensis]|uniref:P-type Zn(2+) transporter n=1 Tax=Echinicola rosea TaxID=1807691 RepID=A0ABQ1V7J8_9BACT|nr:cadmium/zinc/cobalt-transporting ATPase [Echinicola rosea]